MEMETNEKTMVAELNGENNVVYLSGVIIEGLHFPDDSEDENFYVTQIRTARLSGTDDVIPLRIPTILLGENRWLKGNRVAILGNLHSKKYYDSDNQKHRNVFVWVNEIMVIDDYFEEVFEHREDKNTVYLSGVITNSSPARKTPSTNRLISDFFLAVDVDPDNKEYIPCIAWGYNAQFVETIPLYSSVELCGRIQSRDYFKKSENCIKTTYELSVSSLILH